MKKNDPKIILNVSLTSEELEEKVKIAMDQYVEKLVIKELDDTIVKLVNRRIDRLITGSYWDSDAKIEGVSFNQFVRNRTEKALSEAIDKNAKEILAKKLAALI